MAGIGSIEIEVRPTVSLESAAACVVMLNLFLEANDGYRLALVGGSWELTDKPVMRGASGDE